MELEHWSDRKKLRRRKGKGPTGRRGYYARESTAIYVLQMREAIMRWTREGMPDQEIAERLGQSVGTIKKYRKQSIQHSRQREAYQLTTRQRIPAVYDPPPPAEPVPPTYKARRYVGPGTYIMNDPQQFRKARQQRAYWPAEERGIKQDFLPDDDDFLSDAELDEIEAQVAAEAAEVLAHTDDDGDSFEPTPRRSEASADPEDGEEWEDVDEANVPSPSPPPASSSAPPIPEYTANPLFLRTLPPPPPRDQTASGSRARQGDVLDSPEVEKLRRDCLRLRKAMMPFEQMAEVLGITPTEARRYAAEAINELQKSEHFNADMHRQLMIEQIDQMIAAIHAPATGYNILGQKTPVIFDAIDRMLKLMKQKSELLGITEPPPADIRIKLQQLAAEGSYDIVDLEDIARDVLQAHRLRLPEFR